MKVDLDLVQSTFIWRSTYDELKAQLGRPPTDAEVEFRSQVPRERVYDRPFLVSEEESVEDTNPGLEQYVEEDGIEMVAAKWYERQLTKVLLGVLSEVVGGDEILRVLLSTLGLDRGVPRSTSEVASHLGIGPRKTRQLELLGYDTLKHPMYRGQFQRVLVNIESREDLVD
jgi:DNA-directed RNA polymerase sigma subunit (sigma70/sigma32)